MWAVESTKEEAIYGSGKHQEKADSTTDVALVVATTTFLIRWSVFPF